MPVKMNKRKASEYEYEGMVMVKESFPAWVLDKMKETLFDDSDIFIATYPKCGKLEVFHIFLIVIIRLHHVHGILKFVNFLH